MLRCCESGRLPQENCEYLERILREPHDLPPPAVIAKQVHFTNAQRERHRIWTVPPVDMTEEQLAEQRREKDRRRKMLVRRRARAQTREAYLALVASEKPWIKEGKSERSFYRHRAKARAAAEMQSKMMSDQQKGELAMTRDEAIRLSARIESARERLRALWQRTGQIGHGATEEEVLAAYEAALKDDPDLALPSKYPIGTKQ
jgi:hypothetical protein